jgi:hypothetical protein
MNITSKRVISLSHSIMILTSIHHIYGAVIYHTPWRYHAVYVAIVVILFTTILDQLQKRAAASIQSIFFYLNMSIIFLVSGVLIGGFEGIYNHLIKNIMFFGGFDSQIMMALFPPPKYEMPNDFVFELTGVFQAFLAIALGIEIYKILRGASLKHKTAK